MLRAHSVEEIRRAEKLAAEDAGWDTLMQRAASGLALAAEEMFDPEEPIVVLAGPGNNGADALYAGARLAERGREVRLCLLEPDNVHAPALKAARRLGAEVASSPEGNTQCIDGLFGIGARAGLEDTAAAWAQWRDRDEPLTLAADAPSGIGVDDGTLPDECFRADRTVTFGTHKIGLLAGPAADAAALDGGTPTLVDIGLGPYLGDADLEAIEAGDGQLLADALFGADVVHKYTRGVVGVVAGSSTYPGAAHLAVAGAQAGPAGMVRYVGSPPLAARVVDRAPEVVTGLGRVQAWVVGPGSGDGVGEFLDAALADGSPVVVDAAALELLPEPIGSPALLTPHTGELADMLDVERTAVEADPLRYAREAARYWEATVLLKGKRTIVVGPDGPARVNLSGTPWLATAGSGDVLAGLAGSLLAAGLDPLDAGSLAAFLHGAAAVAANPGGPVTASDIARALPGVTARFLAGTLTDVRLW